MARDSECSPRGEAEMCSRVHGVLPVGMGCCVRAHDSSSTDACARTRPGRCRERTGCRAWPPWAALLRVHAALLPRFDQELQAAHGLPITWYDVLLELNAAPDRRLTMGELGAVAVVSRSRVSRVVDELVKAGLVAREPNPDDRRSAFAVLTSQGRAVLRKAAPTYVAAVQRDFAAHFTAREGEIMARALRRVLAADAPDPVPESPDGRAR